MDALVLDQVHKAYNNTRAVNGLSARIPAGIIQGFLGPNGAGKTTTLRMVMNILQPDSGRIEVLGHSSHVQKDNRVAYMPEERGLYPKMTVGNMLAYIGAMKGMNRQAMSSAINEWLEKVGLSQCLKKRVEELSRGMQQKIQFIATVINKPALVIFDEPFQGLDPVNLEMIRNLMVELRDSGTTVILSTHMMDLAERLCDSLILINRGEKALHGTFYEIRATYTSNVVLLEAEGALDFLDTLPMVNAISRTGRLLEIDLNSNGDPQALLQAVMARASVVRFEVKRPSLHEIFVQKVGEA